MKTTSPLVYVNTDPYPVLDKVDIPNTFDGKMLDSTQSKPLHPLRLAVKDLFHIQGVPTSAGNPCWLRSHELPSSTNSTVALLVSKGAVYQGKTLTDELAYSLNGQNVHFPELVNPITPNRLPGGSSSGSAVAVSAGLADIGLGTDTGGSIRVPASYNGIFGLRTSHGRIRCDNMVALAPSFDTVGWMCRSLEHLTKVATVVLNQQDEDAFADIAELSQIKITALHNIIERSEHSDDINTWLTALVEQGNHVVTRQTLDLISLNVSETFRRLQAYDIWQQHGHWISKTKPVFAKDVATRFQWCSTITTSEYSLACVQQAKITQVLNAVFESSDVIVLPTTPGRSPLVTMGPEQLNDYRNNLITFTAIAGLVGLPQIHLPLFTIAGAPVGLSLIAPKNRDLKLLAVAKLLMKVST